jgi:hypothetical protein
LMLISDPGLRTIGKLWYFENSFLPSKNTFHTNQPIFISKSETFKNCVQSISKNWIQKCNHFSD